jgi:DNA-binding HxlR family transcriptional regulator
MDVISKKWALLIINALGNSDRLRFNALMEQLEGVSPKICGSSLNMLQQMRWLRQNLQKMKIEILR